MKRKYIKKIYWDFLSFPENEGYSSNERIGIAYHLRKGKRKFLYTEIIDNQMVIMQDEIRKHYLSDLPKIISGNVFLYDNLKK